MSWEQQITEIAIHANRWLDFALICAVIGFVLALACAVWLIVLIKKTEAADNNINQKIGGKDG